MCGRGQSFCSGISPVLGQLGSAAGWCLRLARGCGHCVHRGRPDCCEAHARVATAEPQLTLPWRLLSRPNGAASTLTTFHTRNCDGTSTIAERRSSWRQQGQCSADGLRLTITFTITFIWHWESRRFTAAPPAAFFSHLIPPALLMYFPDVLPKCTATSRLPPVLQETPREFSWFRPWSAPPNRFEQFI